MSHPSSCKDPSCTLSYRDHLLGIGFTAAAMPSRTVNKTPGQPDEPAIQASIREKRWERDMPAFKRLVKEGYHPRTIDGSRMRELKAESEHDINYRPVTIDYSDPT